VPGHPRHGLRARRPPRRAGDVALARHPLPGLLTSTLAAGKPLGIVCHAPAALLAPRHHLAVLGFCLTVFTNAEEAQTGLAEKAPRLLQDRLVALGCEFVEGEP
jgi:putative intracellular protease/amidase